MDQPAHKTHFLFPSTIFVSKEPYMVSTILGSCVAVCLHDRILNIGGINHYMLPLWNGDGLATPKFGNIAIQRLVDEMIKQGALRHNLIAKIFGGGDVLGAKVNFNIGARNVEMAETMLQELHISIVSKNVLGNRGRKIVFDTCSGTVMHNFFHSADQHQILLQNTIAGRK